MQLTTFMKIKFSALFLSVLLVFLFACNSNKQVPNAGKQPGAAENISNAAGKQEQVFEAGDTTTQKTEFGSVKSLRTPEEVKAAEERKKAAEPEIRQQRILEAAELFAGNYCDCAKKGSESEAKSCKDKIMQDVNTVMNDTGMGLTDSEKQLFKSTFDMRTKNCQ